MKKCITALLVLGMLLSLAACTSGGSTETPAASGTSAEPESVTETKDEIEDRTYLDDLPDGLDYDGYDFRIMVYKDGNINNGQFNAWVNFFEMEGETGEPINDAAWKRNLAVEERLNTKITAHEDADWGSVTSAVLRSTQAGEDIYDLVCPGSTEFFTSLITQNALYDVAGGGYMNLEKGYYNHQMIDTYRLGNHVYLFTGTYPYPLLGCPYMIINMDEWEKRNLPDPYEMVENGEWTHAKMAEIVSDLYEDTNGNGKRDTEDFYGLSTVVGGDLKYLFHCYGGKILELTEDGFAFSLNSEKSQSIVEKLVSLATSQGFHDNIMIEDGNFLLYMYPSSFFRLRDLEYNYALLPCPKLDESQENYITYGCGNVLCVPITISDADRTTAILEALYSATYTYMADVFTDTFVENKLLRDEGSQKMYRIITDTTSFEFTRYIDPSNGAMEDFKPLRDLITKKSTDLASAWAKIEEKVTTAYNDFYAQAIH